MYQLLTPPWISMSRTWRSEALVVSSAGDVEEAEDGPRGVPVLPEGGLGAGEGGAAELPVNVEPEGVADHGDDPVFLGRVVRASGTERGSSQRRARASACAGGGGGRPGRLRRVSCAWEAWQRRGRPTAGLALRLPRGWLSDGRQRMDQLILTHGVPTGNSLFPWPSGPDLAYCGP